MFFLDPKKPIATCISGNCDKCAIHKSLNCHFSFKQLLHFYAIVLPTFLLGGAGIYNASERSLVLWIFMSAAFFLIIENRVMCSHCPHYAEPGASLKCWANYGIIKIFKYRPGPMSLLLSLPFWTCYCRSFFFNDNTHYYIHYLEPFHHFV